VFEIARSFQQLTGAKSMPKAEFHGILAVGRSKTDAINKYRLLAMGKGAVAQVSNDGKLAFVTHASHAEQMFNPSTGDMDLETDNQILDTLEFASNSSADIEANHLVCSSGCGAHVVFDSESLVKYCPQCTSALATECDGDEDEDDLGDVDTDEDEDIASESDDDESDDEEEDDDSSEEDDAEDDEDEDSSVVVSSSFKEAMRVFSAHKKLSSMSSGTKVKTQYVVCSSAGCGVHILSDKNVSECPICLSEVQEPSEDVAGEIDLSEKPVEEAVATKVTVSKSEDLGDGEVPGDNVEDASTEDEGEGDDAAAEEGTDEGAAEEDEGSEDAGEEDAAAAESSDADKSTSGDDESDDASEDEEDEGNALSVLDDSSEDEGDELGEDTEEIAADSDLDESASADDLDVSYSSTVAGCAAWTAYHKGVPIAMARAATAGKNADIFDTPSFGHAALATAKVSGIKKALAELGFAPIKHKVSVSKEVRRLVDSQVSEQRAALSAEIKGHQEKFMAAMATAAIGINRGFFAGVQNPLKSALWNAMSSAGVRNPEVVIDNAFKAHADAYHSVLFAQANDIVSKPSEVQESLAKTILGTNYQAVSSAQPSDSIESRLAGMGTSVSTEQKPGANTEVSVSTEDTVGMQKIHRAVSSLGRRAR
jgi:rubrerythrin